MLRRLTSHGLWLLCLACWSWGSFAPAQTGTTPPGSDRTLTLEQAVRLALQQNPLLAAVRQQHGIAAAGIVIAQTYPFNPSYFALVMADTGPAEAGINNKVFNEHYVRRSGSAGRGSTGGRRGAVGPVAPTGTSQRRR